MEESLYSIRMHATRAGQHLSGAERLAGEKTLESLAATLVRRALDHPRGRADQLRLTVETVDLRQVQRGRLPDLRTVPVADWRAGRAAAGRLLAEAGVAPRALAAALTALAAGAAPGGVSMRGAMLIDALSGERLEGDPARGVRVSRADLTPAAERELRQGLRRLGLDNLHVREALVVATKVLAAPGILAELCWSDDPGYTAGYVATRRQGYTRFPHLKPVGEERGGRAFFLSGEGFDLERIMDFLERQVLLIDAVGALHGTTVAEG